MKSYRIQAQYHDGSMITREATTPKEAIYNAVDLASDPGVKSVAAVEITESLLFRYGMNTTIPR